MNTNDTKYDDTTLQAAIDNAMVNAIKRMEAVPEGELLKDYVDALDDELHSFEDRDEPLTTNAIRGFGIEAVRARLIAAAKEEQP